MNITAIKCDPKTTFDTNQGGIAVNQGTICFRITTVKQFSIQGLTLHWNNAEIVFKITPDRKWTDNRTEADSTGRPKRAYWFGWSCTAKQIKIKTQTERFGQACMQASSLSEPLDPHPLASSRQFEGTPENNPKAMCFRHGGKDSFKSGSRTVKGWMRPRRGGMGSRVVGK